jgi:hypothetical protein
MDQISLVDNYIADGQKLIWQLVRDGFEVTAAFWLRAPEDNGWHLFIASRVRDQVGPGEGYRALQASLEHLPGIRISLADIKLIGVANAITGAVRKLQQKAGSHRPITIRSSQLSNLAVEEAYIYPPIPRHKRNGVALGKLRLKTAVERSSHKDELVAPLSPRENRAMDQIVASGISPAQADYWIRKKREEEIEREHIPAGTVVKAQVVGFEDDPNPLLLVETADGAQGLTFKNNTEPV